jgi:signal transduction histidine kinase
MAARTRSWLRSHQIAADALLALAVFGLTLPAGPPTAAGHSASTTGWTLAATAAACILLVFRRQTPTLVWLGTTALALVGLILAGGPDAIVLPALVGLYTVASRVPRLAAAGAGLATAIAIAAVVGGELDEGWTSPASYAMLAWFGLAAAIGDATRSRREILAEAEDRAVRAEQTREEEALRRVAEERVRIARDLHDVVAHHIAVINVQAGVADHLLTNDPTRAHESLVHVRNASQLVLSEMATILGLLRSPGDGPETKPSPGLNDADVLVEAARQTGMNVTMTVSGSPGALPPSLELNAYRLIQESLTNAGRHGTGSASITVTYLPDRLLLAVSNPVAPGTTTEAVGGHGIVGMVERVTALGGVLRTGFSSHGTFDVHCELPMTSVPTQERSARDVRMVP